VTESTTLDSLLLPLADNFEAGNRNFVSIKPSSAEEYEPLRECLAWLVAEGYVENSEKLGLYRFTDKGYKEYKSRIAALRGLGRSL
jgi:hypothetical protein